MQIFSSQLMFATDDLHKTIEYTVPGTYTFKLSRRTRAKLWMVGGGACRTISYSRYTGYWYYPGSGGAAFVGSVYLPAGIYSVVVGNSIEGPQTSDSYGWMKTGTSEDSILSNNISGTLLNAGGCHELGANGKLTISANLEIQYGTVEVESDGNMATFNSGDPGAASLYDGWGRGGDGVANVENDNHTTGYFKIEY